MTELDGVEVEVNPSQQVGGHLDPEEAHLEEARLEEARRRIDLSDVFTPDPGTEDMYRVENNPFAFSPGHLSKLLNPKSLPVLYAMGGITGLENGLRTNCREGLQVDEGSLHGSVPFEAVAPIPTSKYGKFGNAIPQITTEAAIHIPPPEALDPNSPFIDRKRVFRDNRLPDKKNKSLLQLAWMAYNDKVMILLTIAALVSLGLGLYETFGTKHAEGEPRVEWIEGVAILVAIFIVVVVGTLNDWKMQRQFSRLHKQTTDRTVNVVRSGKSQEISVLDIMVGDVMHIATGDVVPVDGIFIDGTSVKCDESSATGESDLLKKTAASEFNRLWATGFDPAENLDPFIISGSKVNEGSGKFLVTAVGVNSSYGRISMSLRTEEEDTPLQKKLNTLADWIAKFGGGAALLLFVVLLSKWLEALKNNHGTAAEKALEFMDIVIVAVTVVVVAVPEGLPLAVTLALSFATVKMLRDNNLVRVLKACETMGNATTVCSDKTGTLTQNKMTVVAMTLGKTISFGESGEPADESLVQNKEPLITSNESEEAFLAQLDYVTRGFLIQSMVLNSTAFETDSDSEERFVGSKTEVALLEFCRTKLGAGPISAIRAGAQITKEIPFNSKNKYSAVAVEIPNNKIRVYVKGASEILLEKCTKIVDVASENSLAELSRREPHNNFVLEPVLRSEELTAQDRKQLEGVISSYAGQSLRTIASSFRDFDRNEWPFGVDFINDDFDLDDFDTAHHDMTLFGIYGIKDPLRPSVIDALEDCKRAGVVVRMVTGDNIRTAMAIASECGIYRPDDGGIAMEGPEFRRLPPEELKQKVKKLQVLARSSPEDKRILVRTLKDLGETVAVTGDGTNDAPALKMADIGFSMGIAGTEVAKEASSIVLLDDNFASIVKGLMWGRAVNDSVKKFLQFQLTVNITAVVLTFVTAVASSHRESVLNAVQLLWVNLIMDTFAALALATDPPTRSVLDRKPERKSASLITLRMTKMIIGQAICQLVVTLILNFYGHKVMGYGNSEHDKLALKTLVFNTFVWLQIFNELNNRRLDNKLNIFEGIQNNLFFIAINFLMIGGQVLIIFVGGEAFEITPLNSLEWGVSILLGLTALPLGALIRLIPDSWIAACVPECIRKRWVARSSDEEAVSGDHVSHDEVRARPLRIMSSLRGPRVQQSIGFRDRVRNIKAKASAALDTPNGPPRSE